MRFLPLLLVIFAIGCSGNNKSNETEIEKKAREVLKAILKGDASPEKGGITIPGPGEDSKITLSVSGKKAAIGLPKKLEKKFIPPGVKVLSYIRGVDYDTINASLEDSLDAVEIKYNKILLSAGYQKLNSMQRDGLLSIKWVKPENESRVFVYGYKEGESSRLFIVFTPVL